MKKYFSKNNTLRVCQTQRSKSTCLSTSRIDLTSPNYLTKYYVSRVGGRTWIDYLHLFAFSPSFYYIGGFMLG